MNRRPNSQSFSKIESLESRTLFSTSFLSQLTPTPTVTGSTIPRNGDVNPYGVAIVAPNAAGGRLVAGDVLVSNFNDSGNVQGTGTTIVEINPNNGHQTLFFEGGHNLGLTTALGVLPGGFVIVGSVHANNQGNAVAPGELIILNRNGDEIATLSNSQLLDGPWDLTIINNGAVQTVFVANVLNGTVSRLDLLVNPNGKGVPNDVHVLDETRVASGYEFRTDPNAFLVGPTGLAFSAATDTLYVASTGDNEIFAVSNAQFAFNQSGKGKLIFANSHLRGPLALAFAPNGDLITANGDAINQDLSATNPQNSEIVEFTITGKFVGQFQIDPVVGGAFGFALETQGNQTIFAAVDDVTNKLDIWFLQ
jgi:WD40 repeat protein